MSTKSALADGRSVARASAAVNQSVVGLPPSSLRLVVGHQRRSASTGHVAALGRCARIAQPIVTSGIAHQRTAGNAMNGTSRRSRVGG